MAAATRRCVACGYGTTDLGATAKKGSAATILAVAAGVVAVGAALAALYFWRTGTSESATLADEAATVATDGADAVVVLSSDPTDTAAVVVATTTPTTDTVIVTTTSTTTTPTTSTTTIPPTTTPATTQPATTTPVAAAPPPDGTVPGDLSIDGYPMFQPPCDGSFIVSVGSFPPDAPGQILTALERFPGTNYLRTDQTCSSLRAEFPDSAGSWAGQPIYMVVFGPYASLSDACTQQTIARQDQPDAYAKVLESSAESINVNPCD